MYFNYLNCKKKEEDSKVSIIYQHLLVYVILVVLDLSGHVTGHSCRVTGHVTGHSCHVTSHSSHVTIFSGHVFGKHNSIPIGTSNIPKAKVIAIDKIKPVAILI